MKKFILVISILVSGVIFAQQTVLDTLTISANVTLQDPSNLYKIKELRNTEDISKTLEGESNFQSYSDNGNFKGYSYFRIRGMSQSKMAVEFDGIPLLDAEDNGLYLSNFGAMLNQVKDISVEKGTTISGLSSSYAGRINLIPDFEKEFVSLNFGSFNNKDINFAKKIGNFKIGGSLSYTDGYRDESNNKSSSIFLMYKLGNLEFNTIVGNQKNKLSWLGSLESDIQGNRRHNQSKDELDNFTQTLSYLKYSIGNFTIQPYYSYLRGGYDFNLSTFLYTEGSEIYRYELEHNRYGAKLSYAFNLGKLKNTLEVNGSLFDRKHWADWYSNKGFKNEVSTTLKSEYKIGKLKTFLILQDRYTTFDYKGDTDFNKMEWNFINVKAGLGIKSTYYTFGKVTREPTRTDLFGGEENLIEVLGINPETVYSHELGFKSNNIKINSYYSKFKNEIALNGNIGSNSLPLSSNLSKSERYGLEYDLKIHKVFDFRLYGDFSKSKIDKVTSHIMSPENSFNLSVSKEVFKVKGSLEYKYQSEAYINTENTFKVPELHNLNLKLSKEFQEFKVYLNVRNLTNFKGYVYGNMNINNDPVYFVNPSMNFLAGIEWRL